MRVFVAIELTEECRAGLEDAARTLRPLADGVRWVRPEGMHLTLVFIGELADADLPAAVTALETAASAVGPFAMDVRGLGGFPPRGIPRVIHVGCDESTGVLLRLQATVENGLVEAIGLTPEKRAYVPHITLGRVKDSRRCRRMENLQAALPEQEFGRVPVDSFVLMRSELRRDGAVYTPVARFPLAGPAGD